MSHETLHRDTAIEGSSNRSFGLLFLVLFLVIALWPLMSGGAVRLWAAAVAAGFGALAMIVPSWLAAPNRWWMQLGLLLGRVVSPIALGLLFFAVFAPMGVLFRALGKDPLRIKRPAEAPTYWVQRKPPGPKPETLDQQY